MIYLLLAIFFSTLTALILKYSESNKLNRNIVTSVNYIIASLFALVMLLTDDLSIKYDGNFSLEVLAPIFNKNNNGDNIAIAQLTAQGSFLWSLIIGTLTGALYYIGFIIIQVSIKKNGVGLTGAFSKLGIFIPILFSIFIWNEIPSTMKIIGIVLTIFSIFIINKPKEDKSLLKSFNLLLILLLVIIGIGDFTNKIFERYTDLEYKNFYLFVLFFSALIFSLIFTLKDLFLNRSGLQKKELLVGVLVGIPNLFAAFFLIESFSSFTTGVVYSIFSAGTILSITLGAVVIFKEKLSRREYFAIGVIILALVLLNI